MSQERIKSSKLTEVYDDVIKERAIAYKDFYIGYVATHSAPIPEEEEMWGLFMNNLVNKEKLHHA
jgi:hypothetical protein